jgi:hypothetical protein
MIYTWENIMPIRQRPTAQQIIERAHLRAVQLRPHFNFFTGIIAGAGANLLVTNRLNLNPRQTNPTEELSHDINRQLLPLAIAAMLMIVSSRNRNPLHRGLGIGVGLMAMFQIVNFIFNYLNNDHLNAASDTVRAVRRP